MDEVQGKECPGLPIPEEDDEVMVRSPSLAVCSGLWSRRKHLDIRSTLTNIGDGGSPHTYSWSTYIITVL